jgi:predicted MFS family arabinose efflux permease
MLFVLLGGGGLLWLLPWFRIMPQSRRRVDAPEKAPVPSILKLIRVPAAWGTFLGHFCGNYFFYYLLAWLPNYLVREQHLSIRAMSRITSCVFLLIAISTVLTGWTSDRLIASGFSVTHVRKSVVVGGLALASVLMVLAVIPRHLALSAAILALACVGYGMYASNHWAISQTLAGPAMAGRWTSLQNGVANLSGIVAPWLAGLIAQTQGSSKFTFVITGGIALLGACFWGYLVRRVEPVLWEQPVYDVETA